MPPSPTSSDDDDDDFVDSVIFRPFQLAFARKRGPNYWPAAVMGPALLIEGVRVYFFRSKDVGDVAWSDVFGDVAALLHREVSFRKGGAVKRGTVTDILAHETAPAPLFVVQSHGVTHAVSYFNVFLTAKQIANTL
ncbi:uncharacterized protein LOC132707082 [Cylas formicarius]|uniref:uncharacterized protein LOC132707082 n=1 Tax=Cylas formicarius TaxID=197179 RepID=UPI002958AFA7|nr:uncharacterized protein LOC132707082 [Cylas formicarius]